ncbi:MAG: branched-chain amino acid ABC transporter permease [Chloroflexota bacterium]
MEALAQLLVTSLLLAGVYALVSVGLTLIFGVMRLVNFAHGEYLMLGMYLAFWSFNLWRLDPYLAVLAAGPVFLLVGLATYYLVVRPVVPRPHTVQIFTTVGLSILLQNLALFLWTGDFRFLRTEYTNVVYKLDGVALNFPQVAAFGVSVGATLALFAFLKWSWWGMALRATAQDRQAAVLMGINVDRAYGLAFAVGIALAGLAGALIAPLYAVYPTAGLQFVLVAYVVVVLGGLGSLIGALVGSLVIALLDVVGAFLVGVAWKEALYFMVFLLVLLVRPAGFFGQRGAEEFRA